MKKALFTTATFCMASLATFAQSDQVTLNINLYPIQTIEVNAIQKTVNLDYISEQDYKDGVQMDQADHLNTYSTGGFTIKVNSSDQSLTNSNNENISSSDITITPLLGAANPLAGATFTPVTLTTEPRAIISNDTGGINKTFGINYKAKGNDEYLNKYTKSSGSPTVYSTQIIYSMEAR